MQPVKAYIIFVFLIIISGCAGNDAVLKEQREMDTRITLLTEGYTNVNAKLEELTKELNELQEQVKINSTANEEIKRAIGKMKVEQNSISTVKSTNTVSKPAPRKDVVNNELTPANKDKTDQDEYMKAYGLFSDNNFSGAIEAFSSFIKKHPASVYAGNAQYWIGECHYTRQDFPKAIEAFNRVLNSYPKGKKVPDAMLKIGFSCISLNDQAKAKLVLQNLVDKYPNSQAAVKARERLSHF